MKICVFGRSLPAHATGGMELHIETLTAELVKQGADVTLITTKHPSGQEFESREGVKIYYLKGTLPGRYEGGYFRKSAEKFMQLNSAEKYDVIHSQSAGAYGVLASGLNKRLNIPGVVSLHGTSVDEIKTKLRLGFDLRSKISLIKNLYNYLFKDKKYLRAADAVIATSDSQIDVIMKYYGVSREKINLVYNGIDEELFTPGLFDAVAGGKYGISKGDPVVFALARLKKEKGVQNIITVAARLKNTIPGIKLIIGGDGEYKATLIKQARGLGLTDSIQFIGRVVYSDIPGLLNISKVFVNSTIRENGYDLTIPQAMASAKPVVASDIRSVFTVIESGKNGYIYPRNDLGALEELVQKLLQDETRAKAIGIAARKTVEEKFSLRSMARNTMSVYNKIMENSK